MNKLLDRTTYEQLVEHVRREADQLLSGLIDQELARVAAAATGPEGELIEWTVERKLRDIQQRLTAAQMILVDPSDRRYHAAQSVLRDLPLKLLEPRRAAA